MTTVPPNRQPLDHVQLQLSMYRHRGSTNLAAVGDLDQASAPTLTSATEQICRLPGQVLILDLDGLTFCDCAGFGALLSTTAPAPSRRQDAGTAQPATPGPTTVLDHWVRPHLDSHPLPRCTSNDRHAAAPPHRAQPKRAPTRIATADPP